MIGLDAFNVSMIRALAYPTLASNSLDPTGCRRGRSARSLYTKPACDLRLLDRQYRVDCGLQVSIISDSISRVRFEFVHVSVYADELATVFDHLQYLDDPMAYKFGQAFEVKVNQ
jgi:hypothetical protein